MRLGFAKSDLTPRVGVELCGFGPYLNRHSVGVRDRLWARAMAVEVGSQRAVIISNDLTLLELPTVERVRSLISEQTGLPPEAVLVHCTHTHSAPNTCTRLHGQGTLDPPYMAALPARIARAGVQALANLREGTLSHAEVPCEGIGLNREYDQDGQPLEDVLRDDWRPAHPELTDTTCHVLSARDERGTLMGFASYFGCHPVVCCSASRFIHGDFVGVAANLLEREYPGSVGLVLQGALGDVNSCVVHKPEQESLLALEVIAGRYARAVRAGLEAGERLEVADLRLALQEATFTRRDVSVVALRGLLAEQNAILSQGASDDDPHLRTASYYTPALKGLIERLERGEAIARPTQLHGLRLGPLALLGAPFEVFQAIKREVVAAARCPLPLVMGQTNDVCGYAPDRTAAARGGFATDIVPFMHGTLPYANIHDELVSALVSLDAALQ